MSDLIERAKAAMEGATPGPWVAIHTGVYANYKGPHQPICEPVGIFHCPDRAPQKGEPCRGYADSGLIALAPDLARALIDTTAERDALRERVARLEAAAKSAAFDIQDYIDDDTGIGTLEAARDSLRAALQEDTPNE